MTLKKLLFPVLVLFAFSACHNNPSSSSAASPGMRTAPAVKIYKAAVLDSKKDPVCGMPSSAGMEDTLHVNGKVIGFCSKECKEAYLKEPKSYPIEYKQ